MRRGRGEGGREQERGVWEWRRASSCAFSWDHAVPATQEHAHHFLNIGLQLPHKLQLYYPCTVDPLLDTAELKTNTSLNRNTRIEDTFLFYKDTFCPDWFLRTICNSITYMESRTSIIHTRAYTCTCFHCTM